MTMNESWPEPGSAAELQTYAELQKRLPGLFTEIFEDRRAARTVVVVPGLSMDREVLSRISGVQHYEERQLSMLLLLRLPNTRLVFVTSQPLHPMVVDYYLQMLPGVPTAHARARLTLLSAYDGSPVSLSQKILDRPRLLERLRQATGDLALAHLSVFNATPLERTLAVRLGIPMYACDPALAHLGNKSGSRKIFRATGVPFPDGSEDLRDARDIIAAIAQLRSRQPTLRRVVVKLNEGFSGEGNATLDLAGAAGCTSLEAWLEEHLPGLLQYEAVGEDWDGFCAKFARMGGVVEAFVEGEEKRSPSVQLRINPLGQVEYISTHDQVLGGPHGQVFLGSTFPAEEGYRLLIQRQAAVIAGELARQGVLGRFAIDFVVVRTPTGWESSAIEINIRKGGTTHPAQMMKFLTEGDYSPEDGLFRTPAGAERYYYATDNLSHHAFRRLTPDDLIDIAVNHDLHFDAGLQQGVAFSLLGAVSEYGKIGMTAIADSPQACVERFRRAVDVLKHAAGAHEDGGRG